MRLTDELRQELDAFKGFVAVALPRARVTIDAEGWPLVPARYGNLHWRGREWRTGEARVWAYTGRAKMIAKLHAVPGVHRWQTGDREAAAWIAAGDVATIQRVAALFQVRIRRSSSTGRSAEALAGVRAQRQPIVIPAPILEAAAP